MCIAANRYHIKRCTIQRRACFMYVGWQCPPPPNQLAFWWVIAQKPMNIQCVNYFVRIIDKIFHDISIVFHEYNQRSAVTVIASTTIVQIRLWFRVLNGVTLVALRWRLCRNTKLLQAICVSVHHQLYFSMCLSNSAFPISASIIRCTSHIIHTICGVMFSYVMVVLIHIL